MNKNYESNYSLLKENYLSTDDVLIVPSTGTVSSRKNIDLDSDTFIYSSPMDTVASDDLFYSMLSTKQSSLSCRFVSNSDRLSQLEKFYANPNYWFSVGVSESDIELLDTWYSQLPVKSKINIAVDVAHGDTLQLHKIYMKYRNKPWCKNLMSGTVATSTSALNCYNAGCNYIRVGIGPGSACSTRIVTGCGVPNLSAVFDVWDSFQDSPCKPTIIADGGIKTSGDVAKYLAAGADGVMIGSLLSKTTESGGWKTNKLKFILSFLTLGLFFRNYTYKSYRGQASSEFQIDTKGYVSGAPEGVQAPPQQPAYDYEYFYDNLVSALRSTLSYTGFTSLKDLNPRNVKLIRITQNAVKESRPHILS
jgi:IMP dehydrogenase/GMP reductase